MSPVVLRSGSCRVYFVGHDLNEPPHVHVDRDDLSAKLWLDPVSMAYNLGFSPKELRKIAGVILENRETLLEAWHGYFGT